MKTIIAALIIVLTGSVFSQTLNITSHNLKENSTEKKYEITVNYPQIDFGPEALMGMRGVAEDINVEITKLFNGQVVAFRELSAEDNYDCPQPLNYMEINYTTAYKNNGYLSFMFETYSNPRCAAHPMTFQNSFNYSYVSKGLLTIDSLFTPDSGWLEYISDYCIKELNAKAKKDGLENNENNIKEGAGPKPENFNTFTVNDHTLEITFNLYKVGPYVWGFQTVSIPWKNLVKMVDPKGPLGFMVK